MLFILINQSLFYNLNYIKFNQLTKSIFNTYKMILLQNHLFQYLQFFHFFILLFFFLLRLKDQLTLLSFLHFKINYFFSFSILHGIYNKTHFFFLFFLFFILHSLHLHLHSLIQLFNYNLNIIFIIFNHSLSILH